MTAGFTYRELVSFRANTIPGDEFTEVSVKEQPGTAHEYEKLSAVYAYPGDGVQDLGDGGKYMQLQLKIYRQPC